MDKQVKFTVSNIAELINSSKDWTDWQDSKDGVSRESPNYWRTRSLLRHFQWEISQHLRVNNEYINEMLNGVTDGKGNIVNGFKKLPMTKRSFYQSLRSMLKRHPEVIYARNDLEWCWDRTPNQREILHHPNFGPFINDLKSYLISYILRYKIKNVNHLRFFAMAFQGHSWYTYYKEIYSILPKLSIEEQRAFFLLMYLCPKANILPKLTNDLYDALLVKH